MMAYPQHLLPPKMVAMTHQSYSNWRAPKGGILAFNNICHQTPPMKISFGHHWEGGDD